MLRILIPVLDSLNYVPAVRHVIGRAMRGERVEAHLLHVRRPLSLYVARWVAASDRAAYHRQAAERLLLPAQELLARCHVPCVLHVELGEKAPAIVGVARRLKVHRIVLGAARDNTLTRFVEDAVIEKVSALAPMPVDVVAGRSVSRLERFGVPLGFGAALGLLWLRLND